MDPNAAPPAEEEGEDKTKTSESPPGTETTTTPTAAETSDTTATATPTVKPQICRKGKCQPYDPAKDRVNSFISYRREVPARVEESSEVGRAQEGNLLEV